MPTFPKDTPWRSKKYLDYIRDMPCLKCGQKSVYTRNHPHHVSVKNQAQGSKPPDYQTVPLCPKCHAREESQPTWEAEDYFPWIIRYMGQWIKEEAEK